MKVKPSSRRSKLVVAVDAAGIANHAGNAALVELADTLGLTRALSRGMAPSGQRHSEARALPHAPRHRRRRRSRG